MAEPRIWGIVPARSGSKGIKDKNVRLFAGKPLLAWAVEGAKKSGVFEKIILLTDSEAYAEIGKSYGAEVPFLEKPEFARDNAHIFLALKWFLVELEKIEEKPDYVMLLEPTAPGRQAQHIKELAELVVNSGADAGFTAIPIVPHHNAFWQFVVGEKGKPALVTGGEFKNIVRQRSQLPPLYVRSGSTYIAKTTCLLKENPDMYGDDTRALVIEGKYAIDLDTEEDWKKAEESVSQLHG